MRVESAVLCMLCVISCSPVIAAENFGYVGRVTFNNGISGSGASFRTFDSLVDGLSQAGVARVFPGYTGTQPASFAVNFSGLPVFAQFPNSGDTGPGALLTFIVPAAGINQTFQGANRDASIDLLKDFLRRGNNASEIQQQLARYSPFNPLAGNPTSLQAKIVAQDFNSAFTPFATNIVGNPAKVGLASLPGSRYDVAQAGLPAAAGFGALGPLPGVGFGYGNFHSQGLATNQFSLPLSLTYRSPIDPARQLSINLPVTVTDIAGAWAYSVGLGGSYRYPLSQNWAVTGSVNWGITGSSDLDVGGQILGASVTSSYLVQAGEFYISIGNLAGYYHSLKTSIAGVSTDPNIGNTVFRNGVLASHRVPWFGGGLAMEVSFVNTYYTGTDLYLNTYNQVGVALGSHKQADQRGNYLQAGATYLFSSKTDGFTVNVGYWF